MNFFDFGDVFGDGHDNHYNADSLLDDDSEPDYCSYDRDCHTEKR